MSAAIGEASGRRIDRRVLLTILGPALAYPIAGIDPLLLNLNLAAVGQGLGVPTGGLGLLAGASTLVVAASVLAVGNLGDRFGLKRVLVVGLSANVLVGLGSAAAPSYPALVVMRLLDGLSLAALLGVSLALVVASVPSPVRARAIGVVMAIYTVMYGVAPLLGGWVVAAFGWRALFLVTVPFAAIALLLTWRFVEAPARGPSVPFDAAGVGLFGLALLGLVTGIAAAPDGLTHVGCWLPLAVSALAIAALIGHERRAEHPALDLRLFGHRAFLVAVLAIVAANVFAAGLGAVLGQLGGYVLHLSSQSIGLLYLPGTVLVAAASVLAGRTVARRTARPVLVVGLLTITLSAVVMAATASPMMGVAVLACATWLSNLGGFVTGTAAADAILGRAPEGKTGAVAAVQPAFAMTGYALGPTIVILLLDVLFEQRWLADAATEGLPSEQAQAAVGAVTTAVTSSPGVASYDTLVAMAQGLSIGADYTDGVRLAMLVLAIPVLAVAALAFFWLPRR